MWQVGSSQRIDWEKMGGALGFFLSACGGYQLDRRDVEVHMKWMRKRQRCGGGGGGRWRYDERRGVVGNGMKGNEWMNGWMKWNEWMKSFVWCYVAFNECMMELFMHALVLCTHVSELQAYCTNFEQSIHWSSLSPLISPFLSLHHATSSSNINKI